MRIIFNTRHPENVSSELYIHAFSSLEGLSFFDWNSYEDYDIALFMAYANDLPDIEEARKENPELRIGLIDPRNAGIQKYVRYIDFIVVDSVEMKDFFGQFQLPIFIYYEYPNLKRLKKEHVDKKEIIIGYHGNKVHLECMYPNVTRALELLQRQYDIKLMVMYNIEKHGIWKLGVPQGIPINHVQWSNENYYRELAMVDIGIVPALLPIYSLKRVKEKGVITKRGFNYSPDDYLVRFKVPSGPGRIIVFASLGIPVVADMYPSALQFIKDEYNGLVAYSCGGWYNALQKLTFNAKMRQKLADNMVKSIENIVDFTIQNKKFIGFLEKILNDKRSVVLQSITEPRYSFWLFILFRWRSFERNITRVVSKVVSKGLFAGK